VQIIKCGLIFALAFMIGLGSGRESNAQTRIKDTAQAAGGTELLEQSGGKKTPGSTARMDTVVIIGASYARAWSVPELGGMRAINKGINGEQSFEMLQRFAADVIAAKPKAVIIWGFINDIHRTKREEIAAAMARARESTEEMVRLARVNGIQPILATEVTIRGKDDLRSTLAGWVGVILNKTSYQDYVNGHVLETNHWIREFARENRIPLLDFQPLIADEKGFRKKEFATEDGTHISEAAYEKLTHHAKEVFSSLLKNGA
jgi:lysophospholipase L1-like esterase